MGNDILRVILVKQLRGKRVQVDIGTTPNPHLVDITRVIDKPMTIPTVEFEAFDPNTSGPSHREVDRSFENIERKGLELVVEEENDKLRIFIVPRAFLPIIKQCRDETLKTTKNK